MSLLTAGEYIGRTIEIDDEPPRTIVGFNYGLDWYILEDVTLVPSHLVWDVLG